MSARHVAIADIYGVDDASEVSWMDHAVCVEVDPEAFFPAKGEASEPAKELCRSCEARISCLAYALANPQQGVWGGFSEYGRVTVARKYLAGRSLEAIVAADDAAYYERAESAHERAEATMSRQRERQRAKFAEARADIEIPQPREQAA